MALRKGSEGIVVELNSSSLLKIVSTGWRPYARKWTLKRGSKRGVAALFYSLVESCKACDVNPWEYFNDVLGRIMGHPGNDNLKLTICANPKLTTLNFG